MTLDLPRPPFALVFATQALLAALALVGLLVIALLPGLSAEVARDLPEYAGLRNPLLTITIAITVLGLSALGMVALLVQRVYSGAVLTRPSLRRVDVLIAALGGAAALVIASFVVISNGQAGSPVVALLQAMTCLTLIAIACVTLVLRSLLRSAIRLRTELDEVV